MAKSDFGQGCAYNLGLFLAHTYLHKPPQEAKSLVYPLWFNGASDHLYELEIPKMFPQPLRQRLRKFANKCLEFGHGNLLMKAKEKDYLWAIGEAEWLLRAIDRQLCVPSKKAIWQ